MTDEILVVIYLQNFIHCFLFIIFI